MELREIIWKNDAEGNTVGSIDGLELVTIYRTGFVYNIRAYSLGIDELCNDTIEETKERASDAVEKALISLFQ